MSLKLAIILLQWFCCWKVLRQESSLSLQVPMAHGMNKKVTFSQVSRLLNFLLNSASLKITRGISYERSLECFENCKQQKCTLAASKAANNSFVGNLDLDFLEIGSKFNHGRRQKWSIYHFFFIEPESDRWLPLSLTPSLTNSVPFSRLDWLTLACEDANSKLVEVFTVADVDAEKRIGSWSLLIKLIFCSDYVHKVWSRIWSWSSGKNFKLEFS